MTNERWETVKRLFGDAIEAEPSERAALLDRQCKDASVRGEVEGLLREYERSATFLEIDRAERAAVSPNEGRERDTRDRWIGRRLGPYRLTEWIGAGGMGAVYAAERDDDHFQKRVAVKLLESGIASEEMRQRFRLERQVLAKLEHANIARLLDGGSTDDGIPYLVMEYVEGAPIDRYCAEQSLSLDARIDLVLAVCEAVQYAHRSLVVHRDLKPGNILVDESGIAKLLDFGIAKVLEGEGDDPTFDAAESVTTRWSARSAMRLTPRYAAPEQVRGESITTATDVYALSVILYELLTGHHPYRVPGTDEVAIAEAICEVDPIRPSTAVLRRPEDDTPSGIPVRASDRDSVPEHERAQWRRRLRGDLDTIVLAGLRKDPERRYRTVAELAEDLRRYRTGMPILAAMDSVGYRLGKFVVRHRGLVALGTLAFVAIVAGLASTTALWLRTSSLLEETEAAERRESIARSRAEERLEVARSLARAMLYDVTDVVENLPGSTPARELLASTAQHYLDQLADDAADDPQVLRDLATSYLLLAEVRGTGPRGGLGNLGEALASADRGLELLERAHGSGPDDVQLAMSRSSLLYRRGEILRNLGRNEEARAAYVATRALAEQILETEPNARGPLHSVFVSWQAEARVAEKLGELEDALAYYERASRAMDRVLERAPGPEDRRHATLPWLARGTLLVLQLDRVAEAEAEFDRVEAVLEDLGNDPDDVELQSTWQTLLDGQARVALRRGDLDRALERCERGLAIVERFVERDPQNDRHARELSIALELAGDIAIEDRRASDAADHYRESLAIAERLAKVGPDNVLPLDGIVTTAAKLAGVLFQLGEDDETLAASRTAVVAGRRLVAADRGATRPARNLAQALQVEAFVHDRRGRRAKAAEAFRAQYDVARASVERDPDDPWAYRSLANACGGCALQYESSANTSLEDPRWIGPEDAGLVPWSSRASDGTAEADSRRDRYAYAIEQLEIAVEWYRRSTEVAREMESRGLLAPHESGIVELFAKDLDRAKNRLEAVRSDAGLDGGD